MHFINKTNTCISQISPCLSLSDWSIPSQIIHPVLFWIPNEHIGVICANLNCPNSPNLPNPQKLLLLASLKSPNTLYPPNLYSSHSLNYADLISLCSPHLIKLPTLLKYVFHYFPLVGFLLVSQGFASK